MTLKIPNVSAILAVDEKFGLAKNNKIPWKSSKDMQFFRSKTINNVVVMGSKTFLSLPNSQPLKDRINLVVTNNSKKYYKLYSKYYNVLFIDRLQVIEIMKCCYKDKTIFVIGGNQIYNLLLPYCSTIWLTKIKSNYECDLIFSYDMSTYKQTLVEEDDELAIIKLH